MQKNDQEESVVKKPINFTHLGKRILWGLLREFWGLLRGFFSFLKELFSRSSLVSFFIVVLLVFFLLFDNFREKYSEWFFDGIGRISGKALIQNDYTIHGSVDAAVSRPFIDPAQACWYYHANYTHSHAYTVLWNKPDDKDSYPRIRAIAEPAHWQAEDCTNEKGEVRLIGIEYTKHSIEARLTKNHDFVQVATSVAYYRSALFFDKNGRITERKILSNKDRKESNFEYVSSAVLCDLIKDATEKSGKVECFNPENGKENTPESVEGRPNSNENKEYTFKNLKVKKDNFNILQVDVSPKWSEEYSQAIILYIKEREKLHKELVEEGCGAISIEPGLTKDSGKLIQTSIAFLCLNKSGPARSHVRLMHRVNEQEF